MIYAYPEDKNKILMQYADENGIAINTYLKNIIDMFAIPSHQTLIISELSDLSNTLSGIIHILSSLSKNNITVFSTRKEEWYTYNHTVINSFDHLIELESRLISERTKRGLIKAKLKGKQLGCPIGTKKKSILDDKEDQIKEYLGLKVSKASIAKILRVPRSTLRKFIESRKITG